MTQISRAKIVNGVWTRKIPPEWRQSDRWRTAIDKSVLEDSRLKECRFIAEGCGAILISAEELRRAVVDGPEYDKGRKWGPFNINPARGTVADQLVQMKFDPEDVIVSNSDDDEWFTEGRERHFRHRRKERNRMAVLRKKAQVLARCDALICEVCDHDFSKSYGALGLGFAECHHRVPMAELKEEHRIKLRELAIVCANCHRILHRRPYHTIEELRTVVQRLRGNEDSA